MTELKKLKDMKFCVNGCLSQELRKEVIKWIKFIRSTKFYEIQRSNIFKDSNGYSENWIMMFFGITEEDLK